MNINNIKEQDIEMLISSLSVNPNIEGHRKEDISAVVKITIKRAKKRRCLESSY